MVDSRTVANQAMGFKKASFTLASLSTVEGQNSMSWVMVGCSSGFVLRFKTSAGLDKSDFDCYAVFEEKHLS